MHPGFKCPGRGAAGGGQATALLPRRPEAWEYPGTIGLSDLAYQGYPKAEQALGSAGAQGVPPQIPMSQGHPEPCQRVHNESLRPRTQGQPKPGPTWGGTCGGTPAGCQEQATGKLTWAREDNQAPKAQADLCVRSLEAPQVALESNEGEGRRPMRKMAEGG